MAVNGGTSARVKWWTTRITMGIFFLTGGIDYSVMLPTMWDYVHKMGGQEWLYGLSRAAFSISDLISAPLYGLAFDLTGKTKIIVIIALLFEVGGNFMYFSATSNYMLLGSRFIVGVGAGGGAVIYGELARTSTKKERTAIISLFVTLRHIGFIIGPALNLFLCLLDVHIGPFILNKLTSPGALMTVVSIILALMVLGLFFHLPSAKEKEEEDKGEKKEKEEEEDEGKGDSETSSLSGQTSREGTSLISQFEIEPDSSTEKSSPSVFSICYALQKAKRYVLFVASELVKEEIVLILFILAVTMFNQTCIETFMVPMFEELLGWTERDVGIFFSCIGIEIIAVAFFVMVLSRWIGDRWLLVMGLVPSLLGYSLGLMSIGPNKKTAYVTPSVVVASVLIIFGIPCIIIAADSLYSKVLAMKVQADTLFDWDINPDDSSILRHSIIFAAGIGQGIRRSIFSLSSIMGPLWAGAGLTLDTYYILLSVPLGLLVLATILLALSFSTLKEPRRL